MKIDHEYLKNLLIAFEDNENLETDIKYLSTKGFNPNQEKFIFHMRILDDQGLMAQSNGKDGFGLYQGMDSYSWSVVPLRLTASGHDFIAALRQKEVWNNVRDNFKDASISMLIDVSKELARGFAMKQAKRLTGFDPD